MLIAYVSSGAIEGGAAGAAASAASSIENMKAMHDNLVHTSESLKHLSQTQDDRIQQTHAFQQQQMKAMEDKGIHINELAHLGVDGEAARLVNISADPSLSGTLVYFVDTTKTVTVGTARGSPKPDIILSYTASNSIKPIHAIFTSAKKGGPSSDGASKVISAVSITPADTLDETLGIFVNGRRVSSKYRLWHGDRIGTLQLCTIFV